MEKMRNKPQGRMFLAALLWTALLVAADQVTKYFAVLRLKGQKPFVLIKGVFEFSYLENRGAAFGILQGRTWLIIILVTVVMLGIFWLYVKMPEDKRYRPLRMLMVMAAAGAVGNLIDRVRLGFVIDFLYFKLINFPVFNVADCYVTVAAALLFVLLLFYYKEEDFHFIKWLR